MKTQIRRSSLKEKLMLAMKKWAEEEGIHLSKSSRLSVSLYVQEKPFKKTVGAIEWTEDEVTDEDIRKILAQISGKEPHIFLEDMLKTGSREISQEMIDRLASTHELRGKFNHLTKTEEYDSHRKAEHLNSLLIKRRLPYRVSQIKWGCVPLLKKVKLTTITISDPMKKVEIIVSGKVQMKASKYPTT